MRVLYSDKIRGKLLVEIRDIDDEIRIGCRLRDEKKHEFSVEGIGTFHKLSDNAKVVYLSGPDEIGEVVEVI